jgi:excisionase family DNA binding protein
MPPGTPIAGDRETVLDDLGAGARRDCRGPREPHHDVHGVAATLCVSIQTVYLLCARKRLRHIRVGIGRGTIRVPDSALQEYITGATVRSDRPTAPEKRRSRPFNPSRHLRMPS